MTILLATADRLNRPDFDPEALDLPMDERDQKRALWTIMQLTTRLMQYGRRLERQLVANQQEDQPQLPFSDLAATRAVDS